MGMRPPQMKQKRKAQSLKLKEKVRSKIPNNKTEDF